MAARRELRLALTMKLEGEKYNYSDTGELYAERETEPEWQVHCSVIMCTHCPGSDVWKYETVLIPKNTLQTHVTKYTLFLPLFFLSLIRHELTE
jgi:hypothetical protein